MIIIHDIDYFIIKRPPVAFLGTVKTENSIILIIRVIEVLCLYVQQKEMDYSQEKVLPKDASKK